MAGLQTPAPVGGVPGDVEVVRDFVNTTDHETGSDDLTSTAELTSYLHRAGLLTRRTASTPDDLSLARDLRQGLRHALELNHDGASESLPGLGRTLSRLSVQLSWAGNSVELVPVCAGVPGALARIALAMNRTVAAGTWWRLKICASHECEWAYYDNSKNRSRTWCEYGCGNRLKVRAYRERQRANPAT